jgi:predicted phosphoribosyltransferase
VDGKNVIIVDDGTATGNTLTLSIAMLRKNPAKNNSCGSCLPYDSLKANTDEFIYLIASKSFRS